MIARLLASVTGLLLLILLVSDLAFIPHTNQSSAAEQTAEMASSLPASLDLLYPPKAESPVLLLAMRGLNAALAGIVVDLFENDRQGAVANFEDFQVRYREASRLVPEWESWYPSDPIAELEQVVADGPPPEVMEAVGKVGHVCHDCHLVTMVPVQQRYRWPESEMISVHDPVTEADVDYAAFMQMLNTSLVGVGLDLGQGQVENARGQLVGLQLRMGALTESCNACHDTERAYYVGDQVESLLAEMQTAIDVDEPDLAAISELSRQIGQESCTGCHLIHMPAAYSAARMN